MRTLICALALAAVSTGPAFAEQAISAGSRASDASARPARTVYVCDGSASTRRAFVRQFGAVEFVKAEAVVAKGEAWSTPKCMTANEARRLKQLASLR
jgi:hypothetical protein